MNGKLAAQALHPALDFVKTAGEAVQFGTEGFGSCLEGGELTLRLGALLAVPPVDLSQDRLGLAPGPVERESESVQVLADLGEVIADSASGRQIGAP